MNPKIWISLFLFLFCTSAYSKLPFELANRQLNSDQVNKLMIQKEKIVQSWQSSHSNRVRATGLKHHISPKEPFPMPEGAQYDHSCLISPSPVHLDDFFASAPDFGIRSVTTELLHKESFGDAQLGIGHCVFKYQQTFQGIRVLGGEVLVHTTPTGAIRHANGIIIPVDNINLRPLITQQEALSKAQEYWLNHQIPSLVDLPATAELVLWRDGLSGEPSLSDRLSLAFYVEVFDAEGARYSVIVNAEDASVLTALNSHRSLGEIQAWQYSDQPQQVPFWKTGNSYPTSDSSANKLISASSYTWATMKYIFDRNSFDGRNSDMLAIFDALQDDYLKCPNAQWTGVKIQCCRGVLAEDIVAHEWGHAYVSSTADLRYLGESGALSEAYADITGESIQLGYAISVPGKTLQVRDSFSCTPSTSVRWFIGETVAGQMGGIGRSALRDMYNPNCFDNPRYVGDPLTQCSSQDHGGVHTNSGIPNQAYSLLVDGGILNGISVSGIGLDAAFTIWWRALIYYGTSTTRFSEQANNLEKACDDLVGQTIKSVNPGTRHEFILPISACDSVAASILATKLRDPFCGASAVLNSVPPRVYSAWPAFGDASFSDQQSDQIVTEIYAVVSNIRSDSIICRFSSGGYSLVSPGEFSKLDFGYLIACTSPWSEIVGLELVVEFSDDNSETFTTLLPAFTYYQPALLLSITPTSVDANGAILSIHGTDFKAYQGCSPMSLADYNGNIPDCLTCLYGSIQDEYPIAAQYVSDSVILCPFPNVLRFANRQDTYQVSVSKNSQNFWYTDPATTIQVIGTPNPISDPPVSGNPLPADPSSPHDNNKSFEFKVIALIALVVLGILFVILLIFFIRKFTSPRTLDSVEVIDDPPIRDEQDDQIEQFEDFDEPIN